MIAIPISRRAISYSSFVTILVGCLLGAPAIAAPLIVQYTFQSGTCTLTDPTACAATTTASNATATMVNNTGSSADLMYGVAVPNSTFVEQLILSTTAADAVSNNQYFQFTVAANLGYALNLSDLTFDAASGGTSNPRGWVLRSNIDGFGADIATAAIPTIQPAFTPFSIDLTGAAYQGLASPVTFRIYGYAPSAPGVGIFYDNLTLNGEVVPLPSAILMLLGGLGALVPLAKRARH